MPEEPGIPAVSPPPIIDPAVVELLKSILEPIKATVEELKAENIQLREELLKKSNTNFAEGVPRHLRGDNLDVIPGDERFARRVVVATRAADPEFVRRNIPHATNIVDPGGLVQNSKSNPIREEE